MVFIFFWTTFVYDVVAYWTWGARGWLHNLACLNIVYSSAPCLNGVYDFAGGGPVHIASGFAGLAYCLVVGKRRIVKELKPHNISSVLLGTTLLWFGWFGFNGGSAISSTPRAIMASLVTTICAATTGMTWVLFDYVVTKKISAVSFCSGVVAGLVVITPASGFVSPWGSFVMGVIGGITVNLCCKLKDKLGYDDTLDAFGIHGMGGIIGCLLTGIFHQKS
jgi:ammonium transporter, Amt family